MRSMLRLHGAEMTDAMADWLQAGAVQCIFIMTSQSYDDVSLVPGIMTFCSPLEHLDSVT